MTKKLKLESLEVKSFNTSLDPIAKLKLRGGTDPFICEPTDPDPCGTTGCGTRAGCGGGGGGTFYTCNCTLFLSGPCMC